MAAPKPPGVLVTRPLPQAEATAARLSRLGYDPILSPMLRIEAVDPPPALALTGTQAILATSANGVEALARLTGERALPIYTVGDRTADRAREVGFGQVLSAGGDADALAALVLRHANPGGGTILHVRGEHVASSPLPALAANGFETVEAILYRAVAARRLTPEAAQALGSGRTAAILVYSARTAEALAGCLDGMPLDRIAVLGISDVALAPLARLQFRQASAAHAPTETALFEALAKTVPPPLPTDEN